MSLLVVFSWRARFNVPGFNQLFLGLTVTHFDTYTGFLPESWKFRLFRVTYDGRSSILHKLLSTALSIVPPFELALHEIQGIQPRFEVGCQEYDKHFSKYLHSISRSSVKRLFLKILFHVLIVFTNQDPTSIRMFLFHSRSGHLQQQ